jgi:hypothetical protein
MSDILKKAMVQSSKGNGKLIAINHLSPARHHRNSKDSEELVTIIIID